MTTTNNPEPEAWVDPVTDVARLLDVASFDIVSDTVRANLHEFARQAAERLDAPVGMVTIVLDGAQYTAGRHGLDGTWIAEAEGTPVEWAFCAKVVRTGAGYVIEDATADPLWADNPLVVEDGARSYAGSPLITPSGNVLGACCVIGFEARTFSPAQLGELDLLASQVMAELCRNRAA